MKSRPDKALKPSTSKRRRFLIVTLVVLTVGAVAAFGSWRYFKATPAYSLAILIDAAQRDDVQAFDKVFDTDRVVENFLSDLEQRGGMGLAAALPLSLRSRLQSAPPSVVNKIKSGIRDGVRRRINELGESTSSAPFVVTALALYFKTEIKERNDKATVSISRNNQRLELSMVKSGDQWRVVSAKDDALAAQIMANVVKDLPSGFSPTDLAKPLKDVLPKLPLIP